MYPMQKTIIVILIAIIAIGVLGIPLGDPKFVAHGIALELSFLVLAVVSVKKIKYALIPNVIIACIVIGGNTASPQHTEIMITLNPIYNAIILITGGYILQGLLLVTSILAYKNRRHLLSAVEK